MEFPLVHVGSTIICSHAGQISSVSANTRVLVSGQQVVTPQDTFPIAACSFTLTSGSHPCVVTKWFAGAKRVFINRQPALLKSSMGLCQAADQAPQGPPNIIVTQMRVKGT
jgi:hypothetical protein